MINIPTFLDIYEGRVPVPAMEKLIGWKTLKFDPEVGYILGETIARPEFLNTYGTVHGGALCMMLDHAAVLAVFCTMGPGQAAPTIELKANFMRPAKAGRLLAEGRIVSRAAGICFAEASLRDEEGRLLATASATTRQLTSL